MNMSESSLNVNLSESSLDADPVAQFSRWLADAVAAEIPQPNAMVLATASASGRPRARTVLLKAHDASGFVFYTNRTSAKARHLAENPWACLVFPWHAISRQVIVEGSVTAMSAAESEPYFRSRPRDSQLGAWASRQSSVLGSRAELDERFDLLEERWAGEDVPMPDFWGGYVLAPEVLEFWQGRESRLHDRLRYRRSASGTASAERASGTASAERGDEAASAEWAIERLAP
jgi:pyridoxamine 5'-phosphate oxidase